MCKKGQIDWKWLTHFNNQISFWYTMHTTVHIAHHSTPWHTTHTMVHLAHHSTPHTPQHTTWSCTPCHGVHFSQISLQSHVTTHLSQSEGSNLSNLSDLVRNLEILPKIFPPFKEQSCYNSSAKNLPIVYRCLQNSNLKLFFLFGTLENRPRDLGDADWKPS